MSTSTQLRWPLLGMVASCLLIGSSLPAAEITRCNAFNDAATTWAAVKAGSERPLPLRGLEPPVLLPDGSEFKTWEQPAEHRRTFYVAQNQAGASDDNPGTENRPWKTIGRAAELLEPGDRVVVREGLYREWVRPARGGSGPQRMITYQAAPGENVVLSGSEPFAGPWQAAAGDTEVEGTRTWVAELPDALFPDHNPFAQSNLTGNMLTVSRAKRNGWLEPPYSLPQGLVFQDGRRLNQVINRQDLAGSPGTYWVEPGGRQIQLRPFDDKNPAAAAFEVTTRPFAFAPEKTGLGFVRVAGFSVERVAFCFPVPQRGAISTNQGHHWIIENNAVRQVNGLGLDFGRRPTFIPYEVPEDTPKLAGVGHIIRGNSFADCGVCSMSGLGLIGGLVENNYSRGCGWQHVRRLSEAAGIKLHYLKHALVRRNVVHGSIDCYGLWVDHSNANARVTENIVLDAGIRGLFLEASYLPNLIDHNIVWGGEGDAFYQHDCGNLTVVNNLFGCSQGLPVLMRPTRPKGRMVDIETRRYSASRDNRLLGNVFYGFEERGPNIPQGDGNQSDYNLFVNPPQAKPFDLEAWQQRTGREAHSRTFTARMELSTSDWSLHQSPPLARLLCPRMPAVTCDFLTAPRQGDTIQAGPFAPGSLRERIVLREKIPE